MCGLTGFWRSGGVAADTGATIVARMANAIITRGPDDAGVWVDGEAGIALGHRRLSIIDLSAAGHQPMISSSERFVLAYNGEIYNHLQLRAELEAAGKAPNWRGHSDTETLLAGVEAWGLRATLQRAVGMFAIAMWDRRNRTLSLARDRAGEKPLYYGRQGGTFLFGSELKALRMHPEFRGEIDRGALSLLLRHNAIPAPYSIYTGIRKLEPGQLMTIAEDTSCQVENYWSLQDAIENGRRNPFTGTRQEAADALDANLRTAIAGQMLADVPLGAFLSGGVDSSAIVALMQAQAPRPIRTFSIGFFDKTYDEAEHAAKVARHLGTDHTELYVSPEHALSVIPRLPSIYDEPFSDSSQIPTILVSQMAREHVTVSLSGDAGDELFGGYTRYFMTEKLWERLQRLPGWQRQAITRGIGMLSPKTWNALGTAAKTALNHRGLHLLGDKLYKMRSALETRDASVLYKQFVTHWTDPANIVVGGYEPRTKLNNAIQDESIAQYMMALDFVTYLPDDILVKVDRAAMAVSLETRVPFLDHRVIEFAWQLPLEYKINNGTGKSVLRDVLYRYVPKQLIERPKMGFGVPIDQWLRGPLRDWAEDLLDEKRLRQEGYFNPRPIRQKWREHLSGQNDWQYHLWDVLMFQAWLRAQS